MYLGATATPAVSPTASSKATTFITRTAPTVEQGDGIETQGRQLRQHHPRQRDPRHELSGRHHLQHRWQRPGQHHRRQSDLEHRTTTRSSRRRTRSSATTSSSTDRSRCRIIRPAARRTCRSCTTRSSPGNGIEVRNVVGPVVIANNAVSSQSGTAIRLISGNLGLVTVAGNVGRGGLWRRFERLRRRVAASPRISSTATTGFRRSTFSEEQARR